MEVTTVTEAPVRRPAMIDILLVGGRPIVRERLRYLLDSEPGLRVVGDASNAGPALNMIPNVRPDVVIVVPSGGPLARTMRALQRKLPGGGRQVRTILLTNAAGRLNVEHARALGITQVLSTAMSASVLVDTIRTIAADLDQPPRARETRDREAKPATGYPFGLTRREMDVVEAVVRAYMSSCLN
jgi:two-component system, NarL family, response regulator DevR